MNVVDEGHEVEDSANVDRYLGLVIRDLFSKQRAHIMGKESIC